MFATGERHYTVAELAANWSLSQDTVRRLFLNEQGVVIVPQRRKRARIYRPIRIPESVADRVYRRLTNGVHP